jgi:hypothetical protein
MHYPIIEANFSCNISGSVPGLSLQIIEYISDDYVQLKDIIRIPKTKILTLLLMPVLTLKTKGSVLAKRD